VVVVVIVSVFDAHPANKTAARARKLKAINLDFISQPIRSQAGFRMGLLCRPAPEQRTGDLSPFALE
jgi:hypothetical protein